MNTKHEHEINLLEYWCVVKKYKKMIALILAITSVAAVTISLLLQKTYKAEAVIIPISARAGGGSLSALASQFGGLAAMAGIGLNTAISDVEKLVVILKSRTLAESVINRKNLMPILFADKWDDKLGKWKSSDRKNWPTMEGGVYRLRNITKIQDNKKNKTIYISCVFRSPEVAASIVNAYIYELQESINHNAFTSAKRNRMFIEGQLEENKEELLEAGREINDFYSGKRISSSDAKIDVPIASATEPAGNNELLIADYENKNAETQSDETDSKIRNAVVGVVEAKSGGANSMATASAREIELASLMSQKTDLEKKIVDAKTVKNVPQQVYLSYLMLRRELLGKVNALLTSQYEMAKIEESKEDLAFQVIDEAVPPERRFAPRRAVFCIQLFMVALFGSIFLAFFREYLKRMRQLHENRVQ